MKVAIIDFGGGNLQSVKNALDYLNINNEITSQADVIQKADFIILPGQGHFGAVMQQLDKMNLRPIILDCAAKKPFLGICVGMQLLLESSEEAPHIPGLGVVKGSVKRFPSSQKIPQMGWNQVNFIDHSHYFYFAHSYYCEVTDPSWVVAKTDYGTSFPSVINRNQLWAVQFHPEKSGEAGLNFLQETLRNV